MSLEGLSVAADEFRPPNGLLAGAVAGFGENRFEAPPPPKRFFWTEESVLKEDALDLASGDVSMESEAEFAAELVAVCPKMGGFGVEVVGFCWAPKRPLEKGGGAEAWLPNPANPVVPVLEAG